jgi:hypothetical protein
LAPRDGAFGQVGEHGELRALCFGCFKLRLVLAAQKRNQARVAPHEVNRHQRAEEKAQLLEAR